MDTTQLLLTVVLSLTGLLVVIIGVHLIMLLRDVRKTLKKAHKVLEDFHVKPHELAKMIHDTKLSSENKGIKNDMSVIQSSSEVVKVFPSVPLENVIEKMKEISQDRKQIKRFFIKKS